MQEGENVSELLSQIWKSKTGGEGAESGTRDKRQISNNGFAWFLPNSYSNNGIAWFLPISNSNSRFIFSGEISSSHYYSVQDFPEIFLVNHKENVSFHIIAKNDKRNSHISSWPWLFKFMCAMNFLEQKIFSRVEFVEVFSILCYPSLSRIGKTPLCFPTHKCPGSSTLLLNPTNILVWVEFHKMYSFRAPTIFVHKYKWKYGLCQGWVHLSAQRIFQESNHYLG